MVCLRGAIYRVLESQYIIITVQMVGQIFIYIILQLAINIDRVAIYYPIYHFSRYQFEPSLITNGDPNFTTNGPRFLLRSANIDLIYFVHASRPP